MVVKLPSSLGGVELKKILPLCNVSLGRICRNKVFRTTQGHICIDFFPAAPINRKLPNACIAADMLNLLYNMQSRGDRG